MSDRTITLMEDTYLGKGKTKEDMLNDIKEMTTHGHTIINQYNHPAVGLVVELRIDYKPFRVTWIHEDGSTKHSSKNALTKEQAEQRVCDEEPNCFLVIEVKEL